MTSEDATRAGPAPGGGERRAWVPGQRVGPFVVLRLLGQGGMGAVYEVRHATTGATHALKVLLAVDDAHGRARFEREGQAQASLPPHPNVVRVLGAGELEGVPYLLTELAPGGDLRARLRQGPLPPLEAGRMFARLARALEHLHAHGVLHRDLKPHNVVFGEDGAPRLMDFGLAALRGAERLTATGALLGTPHYMAPEQVDGVGVDARTDVYGLGATLYHALAGRPPFDGEAGVNVITKVLTQGPRPLRSLRPDLPADLIRIVERAMARQADARHPSASALAADLEAHAAGRPLAPPRARLGAPAAALLLLALGSLGALAARAPREAPPATGAAPAVVTSAPPAWDPARTSLLVPFDRTRAALPELPPGHRFVRGIDRERSWSGEVALDPGLNEFEVRKGKQRVGALAIVRLPAALRPDGDGRVAINDADGSRLVFVAGGPAVAPFLIGELEATWGQFQRWTRDPAFRPASDGGAPASPPDSPTRDRLPVVGTLDEEAVAYCARVGLRLPTVPEWSHACWGASPDRYPWGPEPPTPARGNLAFGRPAGPTVVGSFPAGRSWCGALDMFGNADEWVFHPQGTVRTGHTCGPSWGDTAEQYTRTATHREGEAANANERRSARGFRVACDLVRLAAPAPLPE